MDNFDLVAPVLTQVDKTELRWGWLHAQGDRCGVCGTGVADRYGYAARWVLDYDRDHGPGAACLPGQECFDCVLGTTCRVCMLHLRHLRQWVGYQPRGMVHDLSPADWVGRAVAYERLGRDAGSVREAGGQAAG